MNITRRQGLQLAMGGLLAGLSGIPARAASDGGTRLILLGTGGGPVPLPGRNQPASVVLINDEPYVVDAGNGVGRQLVLAGIGVQRVGKIFVTHHHDDHNADLGTLMGLAWSNGRSTPIDAYGPPGTESAIAAYREFFRPNADLRMDFDGRSIDPAGLFLGHDVGPGTVHEDDNVKVTAIENTHYPDFGHVDGVHHVSLSYRFDAADRSIVFSGDTAKSDDLVALARGADVLVHEVIDVDRTRELFTRSFAQQGRSIAEVEQLLETVIAIHTPIEQVGEVAAAAQVKTVVLNHFVPGHDPEATDERWIAGVRRHFDGNIIVGQDLMVI